MPVSSNVRLHRQVSLAILRTGPSVKPINCCHRIALDHRTRMHTRLIKILSWFARALAGILVFALSILVLQSTLFELTQDPAIAYETLTEGPAKTLTVSALANTSVNRSIVSSSVNVTVAELALLNSNIYFPKDEYEARCDRNTNRRVQVPGWEEQTGLSAPLACNSSLNAMQYEVWGKYDHGVMHIAIIFRGTVPSQLVHWCSNLRLLDLPICKAEQDQYLAVAPLIDQVIDGIREISGPETYAVVAGHSLGGGLAELAARASFVSVAVTFNSSPVVGANIDKLLQAYRLRDRPAAIRENAIRGSLRCMFADNNPAGLGPVATYRITEHGDMLQAPRLLDQYLTPPAPRTKYRSFRVNLTGGTPIAQHSMKSLACGLSEAAALK